MKEKNRISVVIDTNLFISFLIGKRLKKLKQALIHSKVTLIFSEQNILELRFVSQRPKFQRYFNLDDVDELIDLIYSIGKIITVLSEPGICRDAKDNFLLGLAEEGEVDYLVTSDNDLLVLESYKNTEIINISRFEQILNQQS